MVTLATIWSCLILVTTSSRPVVVTSVDAAGPADQLRPGDRIVLVNESYVFSAKGCQRAMSEALERGYGELDIAVCRGEPFPERPNLDDLTEDDLELLAFEHTGQRLFATPGQEAEFRSEIMPILLARFAPEK
eukprot:m.266246 g.266246  ORF g.266246 m.266246 type:complete len:133 (+) comp19272_c1_seq12:818-1216(+)